MYTQRYFSHYVRQPYRMSQCVLLLVLLAGGVNVSANSAVPTSDGLAQCAVMTDANLRLACFDQLAAQVAQSSHAPTLPEAPVAPQRAATEVATTPPPVAAPTPAVPAPDNSTFADIKKPTTISVKLIEARRSARGHWILTFDNGQIWRQNDSRRRALRGLPLEATISESVLGSYSLKITGQRWSMKVRRLR